MTKIKFLEFFKSEISQRWVDFKLTNKQMADWFDALSGFDVETLRAAVSCHYIEDAPRQPSLKAIIANAAKTNARQPNDWRVFVIRCVEKGKCCVGSKQHIHVMGKNITDETMTATMMRFVKMYEKKRRGKWAAQEHKLEQIDGNIYVSREPMEF